MVSPAEPYLGEQLMCYCAHANKGWVQEHHHLQANLKCPPHMHPIEEMPYEACMQIIPLLWQESIPTYTPPRNATCSGKGTYRP
jgi:hypothetical protein